jgi:hypothetical protein
MITQSHINDAQLLETVDFNMVPRDLRPRRAPDDTE